MFNESRTYSKIDQALPPYTSALIDLDFHNSDDALLVIDSSGSSGEGLSSLSYSNKSTINADYIKWLPLEHQGMSLGKVYTLAHVGKSLASSALQHLLFNISGTDTAQIKSRYYLLRPPVVGDSGNSFVYWDLSSLGNLPRERVKGFNVYALQGKSWNKLLPLQPVNWGMQEQRASFNPVTPQSGTKLEYLVTVVDSLGNEWPQASNQERPEIFLTLDPNYPEPGHSTSYLEMGERVYLKAELSGLEDQRVKWEIIRDNPSTCGDYEQYCQGPLGSLSANGLKAVYTAPGDFSLHKVRVSSVKDPALFAEMQMITTGGFCVVPGTLVTRSDGSQTAIEGLKAGDRIRAWDESSNTLIEADIEAVLTHPQAGRLYRVDAADGDTLRITGNHPVYTVESGWIPVEDLKPGMTLRQWDHRSGVFGDNRVIGIIREESETELVYNLKTSSGNYFANDLLIHNKCLAAGAQIETPNGLRAVESLQPGDIVWNWQDEQLQTTVVTRVYQKTTVLPSLSGKRLSPGNFVTNNHRILYAGKWQSAGESDLPDEQIMGMVYDIQTQDGTYLCAGIIMGAEPQSTRI